MVRKLTRDDVLKYMGEYYRPDAVVIAAAGNVHHDELVDMVAERLAGMSGSRPKRKPEPAVWNVEKRIIKKDTQQVHFCIGVPGFRVTDDRRYALAALDYVLGAGMSSRLFQEIREKHGLAYAIGSYAAGYSDAGMFVVYGGTANRAFEAVLDLVEKECRDIARNSVTDRELERAKNQVRSSMVLAQESMSSRMNALAKNELYYGRIVNTEYVVERMSRVSRDEVAEVAKELMRPESFALAAIGDL